MAVDDVALALIRLEESETRTGVRGGDMSALQDLTLTDEEQQLVTQAAKDQPDVAGFDFTTSAYAPAFQYLSLNRDTLSQPVRKRFIGTFQARYGSAWTLALMG